MAAAPLRIVQISDTHLFAEPEKSLLGVKTEESFSALLELLKAEKFSMILLTGDLTQDGSEASYIKLAERLKQFNVPVYWVPGNHDDTKIMNRVYPLHNIYNQKQIIIDNWQFILLDSHIPKAVEGYLDQSQFDFLESCLKSKPDLNAVIVFHHHPISVGNEWLDKLGLQNADLFWETVANYPKVSAVVFGHVHQEHKGKMKGIKYFSVPSTCIQFKKNSAKFALERLPPAYRWYEFYPNGVIESQVVHGPEYIGFFDENATGY